MKFTATDAQPLDDETNMILVVSDVQTNAPYYGVNVVFNTATREIVDLVAADAISERELTQYLSDIIATAKRAYKDFF